MADEYVEPVKLRRSVLFVPGAESRKLERAREAGADALVLDLEDAVAPDRKDAARRLVAAALRERLFADIDVAVRLNAPGTPEFDADLEAVVDAGASAIMLPKCESAAGVAAVARRLAGAHRLWLLVETPLGVVEAAAIAGASERVEALAFGPADFALAMGLLETDASRGVVHHARCALAIAARARGVAPIDSVHLAVADDVAFREDAVVGLRLGYEGKLCIHPRQVAIANAVYTPSAREIEHARRVIDAFDRSGGAGRGVFALDGRMIDAPVVAAQRRLLERARLAGAL
jgi:citrate lyase beta subunit